MAYCKAHSTCVTREVVYTAHMLVSSSHVKSYPRVLPFPPPVAIYIREMTYYQMATFLECRARGKTALSRFTGFEEL